MNTQAKVETKKSLVSFRNLWALNVATLAVGLFDSGVTHLLSRTATEHTSAFFMVGVFIGLSWFNREKSRG